jgi:hypothetical protein
MTMIHHSHAADAISHLTALLNQFPPGCDPDFDDGLEELDRQFAELRLQFSSNG